MYRIRLLSFFLMGCLAGYGQAKETIGEMLQKLGTVTDSNKVKLLYQIGNYYAGMGKLDSNTMYLEQGLAEAERVDYKPGIARGLTGLGYMYKAQGEYEKAIDYFLKAVRIRESLNLPVDAAASSEAIGRVYIDMDEPDKAIPYFRQAEKVYESYRDSARLLPLFSEIGGYYATKKMFDSAILQYKKALPVYERWIRDSSTILAPRFLANYRSNALTNYSFCLIETGKSAEAISILEPLFAERKLIGGGSRVVVQTFLGYAYLRSGNYKKAADHGEEALAYLDSMPQLNLPNERSDLYRNTSEAHYALGDFKKAYDRYQSFKVISDSLVTGESNKSIAEITTKYETEKKDAQIAGLNKEKRSQRMITGLALGAVVIALGLLIVAYRSKRLQKKLFMQKQQLMVKEKEIEMNELQKKMGQLEQLALRAQMNPHFIFNSLNSVQHFVMKQDMEGVNKYLGLFANLVRQTLNNAGRAFVSLDEEIKYLDTYLSLEKMKSDNKFEYSINVDKDIDQSAVFIPGMILQPFVENSIKHGLASKEKKDGQVRINVSKNGRLVCVIEDNGIGRKKAGDIKLTTGESLHESKGMAITLNRVDIINKLYNSDISIQVDDVNSEEKSEGTRVKVEFPTDME